MISFSIIGTGKALPLLANKQTTACLTFSWLWQLSFTFFNYPTNCKCWLSNNETPPTPLCIFHSRPVTKTDEYGAHHCIKWSDSLFTYEELSKCTLPVNQLLLTFPTSVYKKQSLLILIFFWDSYCLNVTPFSKK